MWGVVGGVSGCMRACSNRGCGVVGWVDRVC